MHPILFEWGPIRIGSYGVLLAMAFAGSIFVTNREFRKNGADIDLAWDIYILAIVGGLVGSRTLFIIENWTSFLEAPAKLIFSPAGFSVIGGYLLAVLLCAIRVHKAGERFLKMADLCAPGMATGYAIGRLGCIAAGDGCYGHPTLCWTGMTFPHGLVPTLSSVNTHLRDLFVQLYPGIPVPADIPVHPSPLYESLSAFFLLGFLLLPGWPIGPGRRLAAFFAWFGISRFLIEFIRLNPIWMLGMSSDQWLSIGIVLVAAGLFLWSRRLEQSTPTVQGS